MAIATNLCVITSLVAALCACKPAAKKAGQSPAPAADTTLASRYTSACIPIYTNNTTEADFYGASTYSFFGSQQFLFISESFFDPKCTTKIQGVTEAGSVAAGGTDASGLGHAELSTQSVTLAFTDLDLADDATSSAECGFDDWSDALQHDVTGKKCSSGTFRPNGSKRSIVRKSLSGGKFAIYTDGTDLSNAAVLAAYTYTPVSP